MHSEKRTAVWAVWTYSILRPAFVFVPKTNLRVKKLPRPVIKRRVVVDDMGARPHGWHDGVFAVDLHIRGRRGCWLQEM